MHIAIMALAALMLVTADECNGAELNLYAGASILLNRPEPPAYGVPNTVKLGQQLPANDPARFESPLGTYGMELVVGDKRVFCEHTSSIPVLNDRPGLNHCGIQVRVGITNW